MGSRLQRLLEGKVDFHALADHWIRGINRCLGRREYGAFYFDGVYRNPDPWAYTTSAYEMEKYAAALEMLPPGRIGRVLEVACSIGVFTQMLAERVEWVEAFDLSVRAVERARERCSGLGNIHIQVSDLLRFESGGYDVVFCTEMLYYLWKPERDRRSAAHKLGSLVAGEGRLIVVHGGEGLEQDWIGVLARHGGLVLTHRQDVADLGRPYTLFEFRHGRAP